VGASYHIKKTGTVLRLAYSRLFLTPYNENLILSSSTGTGTGSGGLAATGIGAFGQAPLKPATRNQFNAGFEQAFGKHLVVDAMYYWKFTQRDYDFDVLFNTPLTFPIQWAKSKIDGFAIRVSMPKWHGLSAFTTMGHTRDRFFNPEVGGILFNSPINSGVFRIDHDEAFEQTTHIQYQPKKNGPWYAFTWRYDSGLVAGAAGTADQLLGLTADQQTQIQLSCNGVRATLTAPITTCAPSGLSSPLVKIPAPGTENDDKNPPRVQPRHLFDMGVGWDNIFRGEHKKWNASLTVVNVTNKVALYNFLSTFSGTHFVTPRSYTGQITFNF
jgi:outer membrane receptor protein involved in Fe transport